MICIFEFVLSFILVSIVFERLRAWTDIAAVSFSGPFWAAVAVLFVVFYAAVKLLVRHLEREAANS